MRISIAFTLAVALSLVLSLIASTSEADAQIPELDPEASGTAYLIAFPDTTTNALDPRYPNTRVRSEFTLWIYSAVANKVRITPNDGGATTTLDVAAGQFKIHSVTGSPVVTEINAKVDNTISVESEYPIVLYCYLATIQGLEAWTPIPIDRWGTEHHSANVPGEVVVDIRTADRRPKMASAEIVMIAAYDNTRISLRPPPGVELLGTPPRDFTLNAGQVFQVQSIVDVDREGAGQPDIAATVITSDKPIGVLSGNTRAKVNYDSVGFRDNVYKNMLMEWIAPSDQHGKEFVFMPTWDNVRPGSGAASERKREYVRLYSTQGRTVAGYYRQPGDTSRVPFNIPIDMLSEFAFDSSTAISFKTDIPSQAFMHSSAIVKFNGFTPCFGDVPCFSYDAWAPYMVEMVPREQWTSFAPYYAPVNPVGMLHYLNVVADTISAQNIYRENGSLFPFARKIPGTDLIWGSISVNPGESNYLAGRNGARFYAFAYGMFKGLEEYRPGGEPPEYEEYNALAYGYPLAPRRSVLTSSVDDRNDGMVRDFSVTAPASGDNAVRIRYALDTREHARLDIYDALGRRTTTLLDEEMAAGEHGMLWDASGYPSGIYYCRIAIGAWSRTVPLILRR